MHSINTTPNYTQYVNLERIRSLHSVKYQLIQLVIFLAVIIYSGYIFNIESLYRPIPNGPATHTLTLISTLLLCGALLLDKIKRRSRKALFLALLSTLIGITRLTEIAFGWDIISSISPFHEVAEQAISDGLSHSMGMNTSLAVVALSLAIILRIKLPKLSFLIGSFALFLTFSSLAGYGFAQEELHGAMSFLTVSLLMPLCIASSIQWAHYKFLRGLFLHTQIGKISRYQIVLSMLIPWLLGAIIVYLGKVNDIYPFALFTTGVSWFSMGMVIFGVILYEKLDSERRTHERRSYRLSTTDSLTSCYNRHMGLKLGTHAAELAERNNTPLSVMMFDIDNFKSINDTYGHAEGDNVLRAISKTIRNGLRRTDILARWGGEEFVAILYDCSSSNSIVLANKIRQTIEQSPFSLKGSDIKITVSVGTASYSQESSNFLDIVENADNAMYKAKHSGKNKVLQYSAADSD